MIEALRSPKLKPWHLDRWAIVYVRQSTPQQVTDHQESTARQYALADRALALGWPRDRVLVIDDDLGKSGQSVEGRPGFQRLLAEVALDHVGLILGLEMSRLARSCKDWHQLLELCARFRTLLADADGLYDPTDYNDRLLLGLNGMMSEAELHILKERMYQGKLNKARRGELMSIPPIGYIRLTSGEWAIDPDEQVQTVVRLIFDQFDREATLHGLLRYLVHHGIRIPVRPHSGPNRGELEWRRPNRETLQNLLHHPIYAGAYRYGHRPIDPRRKQPGRPNTGKLIRRPEECLVLIRDRLPAYITWERFYANQERLDANRARQDRPGAPRQGASLLAGLLRCGRCGRRMAVRYSGRRIDIAITVPTGRPTTPSRSASPSRVRCSTTWSLASPRGARAGGPGGEPGGRRRGRAGAGGIVAALAAAAGAGGYEAERAARQYQAVEPENRLVARELERRWEESLKAQRQLEEEYERWLRTAPGRFSTADEEVIRALAADLPGVWQAATTTPAERQRIARLLLERVTVTVDKTSERVEMELHWTGGLSAPHSVPPGEAVRSPVRLPAVGGAAAGAVRPGEKLGGDRRAVERGGLPTAEAGGSVHGPDGAAADRSPGPDATAAAREPRGPLPRRVSADGPGAAAGDLAGDGAAVAARGWLTARRDAEGHHVIWADASELRRLRELHRLPRTWANKDRLAKLKKPKPRPER